jgi:hypothetical protein
MRRAWCLLALLLAAGLLRSGEQATPRQVIERAIRATGGEEKLTKYQAATAKGKSTIYSPKGEEQTLTGEWAWQGKDRFRSVLKGMVKGQPTEVIEVINGGRGWLKTMGKTVPIKKEQLAEEHAEMYVGWLTRLVPLRGEGFKLSAAGEAAVDGKPAVGVRVEHEGRPAVSLFFDKKSGLLVKSEFTVPSAGKPLVQTIFYKDYKDVQGVREPARVQINVNGRRFVESEATEIRLHERLDDGLFTEP